MPLPCPIAGCWDSRAPTGTRVPVGDPPFPSSPWLHRHRAPQRCHPSLRGCGCHHQGCFKGQLIPILPPPWLFFISFWLGIRHVLTEQTFCCPQNPPPRREATSSLCRCPEPAPAWGEPGLGLGQPFQGRAEPFRVTSCTGAGAWPQLSAPLQSINRFLL